MENKKEIINNLLCMACLCVGRSINEVKEEKLKNYYMNTLNEIPLNNIKTIVPIVCWECEAVLKKVLSFREQVKDSYRILQTYTENLNECLLSDVSRAPRLKVHTNDAIIILPSDDIKLEGSEDLNPKIENDTSSTDVSDAEPEVAIQTVLCDFRWDKKRKNTNRSNKNGTRKVPERDPIEADDFKEIKLESTSIVDCDIVTKTCGLENDEKSIRLKRSCENDNNISDVEKVKMETNADDEDSDFNTEDVQDFLHEIKLSSGSKKSNKIKKISQKIRSIELSYDEMQEERLKTSLEPSFVSAEHKCDTCLVVFNSVTSKTAHHSRKHAISGDYMCSICKIIISSVEAFTAHYKRHMRRYECTLCKKRSSDIKSIYQHLYRKHDLAVKKYKCNVCGAVSNSLDSHRYHKDSHKARIACAQCDKTFSHRAGLMNHRLSVHELQNEFPCTVCDKVFRWKTSLKRHFEKHRDEKSAPSSSRPFCASCGIAFSSVCSLQRHLRNSLKHVTHDQLRFICDHCNQRFADKTKLRDHIEEKHLHRTFHCHICSKPSKNRVGLEQHIRSVHRGRPNNRMCHHCGKGFPTKVQLESHIRTHTGERPFMCEFCPTTFSQQSNLYKHHRQVHLNIKSKRYIRPVDQYTLPAMLQ